MSPQADFIVSNGTGAAVRSDLNVQLAAIVSNNSGATEPATMYAYQWWADTTTGLLKLRNSANSAWIELRQLDGEFTTVPVEDGSAGAPSIYFKTSGTDTGLYSPGADQVGISTGGTARVIVDSNGATLNGQGDLRFADSDSSHFIALQAPATITTNVTLTLPSADGTSGQFISTDGSGTLSFATPASGASNLADGSAATPSVNYSADTNTGIFRAGNDLLAFSTGGTQRAQFDDSGRLLVGTSTSTGFVPPGESFTTAARVQVSGSSSSGASSLQATDTVNGDYGLGGSVFLNKRPSNDTGIGNGHTFGSVYFAGWDTAALKVGASIRAAADGSIWTSGDCPSRLMFSTTADAASSPTERMRITQAGHVLIGCTSLPGGSTKGVGFYITGTDTEYLSSINTTASKNHIIFYNPNGTVGTIATNGSATAYNTSSDYRLKENVTPVLDGITRLQQLKPSRFNFIADPDHTVDGFIAHEAQAIVPECVTGEKDAVDDDGNPAYQGIDQSKLVPLLTAALQEAIGRIETLEAEVSALKGA
jgi:hypothetical protein